MRKNIERLSTSKRAIAILTASAASLALSSCATGGEDEWRIAVTCPENEQEVNIVEVSLSNVILQCTSSEQDGIGVAPVSIELLSGEGIKVSDGVTDASSILTIGYEFESPLYSNDPEIRTMEIREETSDARISMVGVTLTEVSVQSPQEK